ncbi:MAG TPA: IS21-like element helper ATPase IstB [Polyangiaceae bacterium]|nr:IS21-like element helper ATPase IstB [Polyangiaceae bacterium]
MNEELEQLLRTLRLLKVLEVYPEVRTQAERDSITWDDFLLRLLRPERHGRLEQALASRIRRAHLPESWSLETFPYARQPGVNKRQIRSFAELEFIPQAMNIVFVGKTGVGKTGLAIGLLLKALENGHRGAFVRAQDLFDEMYASLADRSSRSLLRHLARLDVLVIDELGYLNIRPEQANVFFKLVSERYGKKSTIITTNLVYEEWHNIFGTRLVEPLLSRLRHCCTTVTIDGPSLRDPKA